MLLKVFVSMMSAAGLEVLLVDLGDDVGPRQHEDVVVAPQIVRMVREPLAAEIGFGQLMPLDHRPHRAVEDEDALRRAGAVEFGANVWVMVIVCRVSRRVSPRGFVSGRQPAR